MSEPQLDRLFSQLGATGFNPALLATDRDFMENLVWYCCDERRAESTLEKLDSESQDKKRKILASLATLYPLTRNILLQSLKKIRYADEFFCMGLDPDKTVLRAIKNIIAEMYKGGRLTNYTTDYHKDIEKLEKDVEALKPRIRERDELEKKLQDLKIQSSQKELEEEIKKLQEDIKGFQNSQENLEMDLNEARQRREELEHEERRIRKELESLQTGADERRNEILKQLFETFPPDNEER